MILFAGLLFLAALASVGTAMRSETGSGRSVILAMAAAGFLISAFVVFLKAIA